MLRDYQIEIKNRLTEEWKTHRSVMVQMPTGTGKTYLLASVVGESVSSSAGGGVWIVAHRRELVAQIEETLARYGIRRGESPVRVMSVQWLSRHRDGAGDAPGLIVVDEAHHALAASYAELWKRYPDARKLGVTATPCRLNRRGFTELFEALVSSPGIAGFIERGVLSVFDYVSVRPDSADRRIVAGLEKRGADGDYQVKEMDAALNRRPGIERLYRSVRRFASGRKGIVYAVSIDHARRIAACYGAHGVKAAAIDSKTPAGERRRLVEEFRQGKIEVLVNVDVFSEGFDCPDVEFVQLARPTLSLAKYLQQVGRGLRRTEGKETCVLIDNVGLYHTFGLPTRPWDWDAMFRGKVAGKGTPPGKEVPTGKELLSGRMNCGTSVAASPTVERPGKIAGNVESGEIAGNVKAAGNVEAAGNVKAAGNVEFGEIAGIGEAGEDLVTIVDHEHLLSFIREQALREKNQEGKDRPSSRRLRAFADRATGLWGLKRGNEVTAEASFKEVLGIRGRFAAVRLPDGCVRVLDDKGALVAEPGRCREVRLLKDDLLQACHAGNAASYVDLRTGRRYPVRPCVLRYGSIELLQVDRTYYSRTKRVYVNACGLPASAIVWMDFYVKMYDGGVPSRCRRMEEDGFCSEPQVCLLEGDEERAYYLCGGLPDRSIVVMDEEGRYYQVEKGRGKRYVACNRPSDRSEDFDEAVALLRKRAEERVEKRLREEEREAERKRRCIIDGSVEAVPFQAGVKWGLRTAERILIPPVYRKLLRPVGGYCAYQDGSCQWGVLAVDGRVIVRAGYMEVEIDGDGTARLTLVPGKMETVKLAD